MESLFNRYLSEAKSKFAGLNATTEYQISIDKNGRADARACELHNEIILVLCHLSSSKRFFQSCGMEEEIEDYSAKYASLLAMLNAYLDE
jgi:hypothetical protein